MPEGFDPEFLRRAIEIARFGMRSGKGGPFGCVVVKDGTIISEGCNEVISTNDPTAHAEIVAIRNACAHLNSFQLDGCSLYTTCEPCPMCLGAIYWARPTVVYYALDRNEAADAGFDDAYIYNELVIDGKARSIPMVEHLEEEAHSLFTEWKEKGDKLSY